MRILVTGGAGFLGCHLCDSLLTSGHEVVVLDNLYTGSLTNISSALESPNFKFIKHDVTKPFPQEEIGEVSQVYHLACPASPVHYQSEPIHTLLTSVLGVHHALEFTLKNENCSILFTSTSEVYGDPDIHPQTEDYRGCVSCTGPRACYDEGKRAGETLCMDYHRTKNAKVRIVRIFNTYGDRMHPKDGRVVSNFIMQALKGEKLTIQGTGEQTRSFCFVDDLIRGLILVMNSEGGLVGPVNLGNPEEYTIHEICTKVLEEVGYESGERIVYVPAAPDDPRKRRPDNSKALKICGWKPTIPLSVGLKKTVEYFRDVVEGKIKEEEVGKL